MMPVSAPQDVGAAVVSRPRARICSRSPTRGTASRCHPLLFDKRFTDGVPHDTPEVIHAFLVKRYTEYIATHLSGIAGDEIDHRVAREASADFAAHLYAAGMGEHARRRSGDCCCGAKTCKAVPRASHSSRRAPAFALGAIGLTSGPAAVLPKVARSNITAAMVPARSNSITKRIARGLARPATRAPPRARRRPTSSCRARRRASNAITRARMRPRRAASSATPITTGATKSR